MAPEHLCAVELFDTLPSRRTSAENQDTVRPKYTVETGKNLKVFIPGNMKQTVERRYAIKSATLESQSSHVHLQLLRFWHMNASQFKH
jgi:hypothetical protein